MSITHEYNVHDRQKRGRQAAWWTSHGGKTLHQWWCRYLLTAPGVEARPALEQSAIDDVLAKVPRHRRCGWCCDQGVNP